MNNEFLSCMRKRRSVYKIGDSIPISNRQLEDTLAEIMLYMPTAVNMQSPRTVLLLGEHHHRLWAIVRETLRKVVPPNAFAKTEKKLAGFEAGYGTILFFDDSKVVEEFSNLYTEYKDTFPEWSLEHCGMHQFAVWTALAGNGIGASLQHYNPLIDDEVKRAWSLPQSWRLLAQMPFGAKLEEPEEKEHEPLEKRLKTFGT